LTKEDREREFEVKVNPPTSLLLPKPEKRARITQNNKTQLLFFQRVRKKLGSFVKVFVVFGLWEIVKT